MSVSASASALAAVSALAKCLSFYVKVSYVMGKALSGELSCPCDRSCLCCCQKHYLRLLLLGGAPVAQWVKGWPTDLADGV